VHLSPFPSGGFPNSAISLNFDYKRIAIARTNAEYSWSLGCVHDGYVDAKSIAIESNYR
jgi:hypothetical protein